MPCRYSLALMLFAINYLKFIKNLWSSNQKTGKFLLSFERNVNIRSVAQLAEQRSPKPQVGGSIPSWPATILDIVMQY